MVSDYARQFAEKCKLVTFGRISRTGTACQFAVKCLQHSSAAHLSAISPKSRDSGEPVNEKTKGAEPGRRRGGPAYSPAAHERWHVADRAWRKGRCYLPANPEVREGQKPR